MIEDPLELQQLWKMFQGPLVHLTFLLAFPWLPVNPSNILISEPVLVWFEGVPGSPGKGHQKGQEAQGGFSKVFKRPLGL